MGTHPIFESDFDCLTDMSRRILRSVVVPSCSFLIYNRNRPRTLNAKSQFNFEKYQTHPTRIKQEIQELECFYLNQIVCKEGIYDKFDGCTDWKMTHSSQSERDQLKVYTRKRPSGETEYRLFSKVETITPRDYLELQLNVDYRKEWDQWVKELYEIECTGTSEWNSRNEACAIRWVQKMPGGFLSPREYIYFREYFHDEENKLIVITAREVEHPEYPPSKGLVRVGNYKSCMVITYDDFDASGLTVMLTYHDDVSKILPSVFRRWSDNKGMRDSQDKLLNQAEQIAEKRIARQLASEASGDAQDQINVQIETSDIPSKTSSN